MIRMEDIDKAALISAIRERLESDLGVVTRAQKASQEGATHEENRAESEKDMRATEVAYLARGQAERVRTLREEIALLASLRPRVFSQEMPVQTTALLRLAEDDQERICFLLPAGAGLRLEHQGITIHLLTPRSPLGQSLLGVHAGDVVGVDGEGGSREVEVVAIA